MNTLEYIIQKYHLDINQKSLPIEIPNTDRLTLADLFRELGHRKGVEIGTERGLYAEEIAKRNPELDLYCVDAWTAYKGYRDHVTQQKLDQIYDDAQKRLIPYKVTLVKEWSMEALDRFDDKSLDFVYIDANHEFKQTVDDITEWTKKVKSGGIVAGHDYIKRKNPEYLMHVVEAVNGYTQAWKISPWFVLGRKEKLQGELRDDARSWFFIKP